MYPLIRIMKEKLKYRRAPRLGLFDTHVSHHRCWPHDLDFYLELNNGRTLTLYDLGRIVLFERIGASDEMRRRRWVGTVAGTSIRYRRRVQAFDRLEMRTRVLGWDARFLYVEQGMWREGTCTSQALLRTAVVGSGSMVPIGEVAAALGAGESPALPGWVRAWIAAEDERPWPPEDRPGCAPPPSAV